MIFMPNDDALEKQCKQIVEDVAAKEGVKVIGWRKVPVDHNVVGRFAKATEPRIWQVMIEGKAGQLGDELERELYVVRKLIEKEKNAKLPAAQAFDFYICTLSNRTMTYKVRACTILALPRQCERRTVSAHQHRHQAYCTLRPDSAC